MTDFFSFTIYLLFMKVNFYVNCSEYFSLCLINFVSFLITTFWRHLFEKKYNYSFNENKRVNKKKEFTCLSN